MKKIITLNLLVFLGYSSSFSQKTLKGKEIGIDLRNFNNTGNVNFLIRKDTKDSLVKKRRNLSFSFQNNSLFPNYPVSVVNDIPKEYKSNTNNFGSINFAWGKENYLRLEELNLKNLYFYHTLMKNVGIINQTSQNLISTFTNNELSHINKTLTNHTSINIGLALLGGIKYNFTSKIAVGIESGINGGINLGTNENKSSQFSITDKVSTKLNTTRSNSTASYFHTNLINAIWFSYKF